MKEFIIENLLAGSTVSFFDVAIKLGLSQKDTPQSHEICYKGFEPDLSCRGYRFVMGKNVTPEANCASNGFHCAENPLDCLSYYGDMNRSIYYLVQPRFFFPLLQFLWLQGQAPVSDWWKG